MTKLIIDSVFEMLLVAAVIIGLIYEEYIADFEQKLFKKIKKLFSKY